MRVVPADRLVVAAKLLLDAVGVEPRGRVIRGCVRWINRTVGSGGVWMGELKSSGKSFEISKWEVQEAWEKVRANKGAAGVDGCSVEDFEKDLQNNLYRVWNRMSSGSYFPPPVLAVEIPKPHGGGVRVLGVEHAISSHGHTDSEELRSGIESALTPEQTAAS